MSKDLLVGALREEIQELEAENARLREALKEIAKGQQPIDYAKPLVTIERLVGIAQESIEGK